MPECLFLINNVDTGVKTSYSAKTHFDLYVSTVSLNRPETTAVHIACGSLWKIFYNSPGIYLEPAFIQSNTVHVYAIVIQYIFIHVCIVLCVHVHVNEFRT